MRQTYVSSRKQSGAAMVLVLWLLSLLVILASGYSRMMRTDMLQTAHMVHAATAQAAAEAGIYDAILFLVDPARTLQPGTPMNDISLEFDSFQLATTIQPENSRIDINHATPELLQGLFEAANIPDAEHLPLVHAILDWRDRDEDAHREGAERDWYERHRPGTAIKNDMFNSVDELMLVKGMKPEYFRAIEPTLTVHSHQLGISPMHAPALALAALPGITETGAAQFLELRQSLEPAAALQLLADIDRQYLSMAATNIYRIRCHAKKNDSETTVEAVVQVNSQGNSPFRILSWQFVQPVEQAVALAGDT
ncbi:MAG: type II secretion system protein GspK [Gammaproteobacteria bacterium]